MRITLQELKKAIHKPLKRSETIVLEDLEKDLPGLVHFSPLHVEVEVQGYSGIFEVQAKQTAEGIFSCARCLQPVDVPFCMEWNRFFTDQPDRAQDTEEREVLLIQGNEIDLTPIIRETLLLHFPFTTVCREDCQGLCPVCGIDRNKESCSCQTERIDPRLAALKALLKNEE